MKNSLQTRKQTLSTRTGRIQYEIRDRDRPFQPVKETDLLL